MLAHYISSKEGIKLYTEEYGNPNGQPILFIHEMSQCRLCWSKQLNSSLADDFRLVTMDIRGHGLSDKPQKGYDTSENWAEDINAVISKLRLYKPVIVAWSYAGLIICDYIKLFGQENISAVNFVSAGTSINTKSTVEFSSPERRALTKGLISNIAERSSSALQNFIKLCYYKPLPVWDFYNILGYNTIVPPYVRRGLIYRTVSNDELLAKISKPVLITHGLKDRVMMVAASLKSSKLVPGGKLSLYADTGHAPFWEEPERFNSELSSFINSIKV